MLSAARGLAAGARQALSVLLPRGLSGTAADVLTSLQTIGSQHSSESACCLTLGDSADVNVRGCMAIQLADSAAEVPAIALRGLLVNARITENTIVGASGLANREVVGLAMGEQPYLVDAAHAAEASRGAGVPYLVTAGLTVRDNDLWCSRAGISMGGLTLHLFETRIAHNRVWAGQSGGIVLTGATGESAQPGVHRLTVEDNLIRVVGPGIVAGTDRARVRGNVVSPNAALNLGRRAAVDEAATQPARRVPHPESGIVVARGLRLDATDDCEVTGNQVVGIAGHGIVVASATGTLRVEANEVTGVGGMGIEMAPGSAGQHMVIRANRLHDVIRVPRNGTLPAAAVRLHDIAHVEVLENMVDGVGQTALGTAGRDGIQLSGSGSRIVRVRGNDLRGFGVSGSALPDSAGVSIDGTAPSAEVDVSTNVVRLSTTPVAPAWRALRIGMPLAPSIEQQIRRAAVGPIGVLEGLIRSTVLRQPPGQATPQAATVGAGAAPVAAQALISVRGNLLEALGPAPTVEINVAGVCTFADNQCLRADSQFSTSTIISLQADAAIFTGNHVRGGGQFAADINTRTNGQVNQAWSVVGNVSVQGVRINGGTGNSSANVNSIAGIGVPTVAEPAAGAPSTRSTG
ncbi:MAG: right-handed parallel beta-helix repeat-containing protein [Chloroflexi bacterium]|nr:right-handed parallel beta-helix repeat-containing protein [Chloroflexota bacterium]